MYNPNDLQKNRFDMNVKKIKEELRELDIKKAVKLYFMRDYEDAEIEAALKGVEVIIKLSTQNSPSVPTPGPTPKPGPVGPAKNKEKIQDWVKRIFRYLLSNHILSEQEIVRLHDKWYSKKTFNIAHALFVDNLKDTVVSGHNRYWKTPICGYYICSQWWLDYEKDYHSNINQWLAKVLPDYKERGLERR